MDRRDFLKITSTAGLGVAAAGLPFASDASAAPYTGTLFVTINAGGGWDVTSHCDPKGSKGMSDPSPMNHYLETDIGTAVGSSSGMKYAPDPAGANKAFFDKYAKDLMVLNGVDNSTNSHDVGSRVTWSGTLVENKPSFAALVAAAYGDSLPMAYVTNGGYDVAAGVVAVTRVGNIDAVRRIAYPNIIDPLYDPNKTPFYTDETQARLTATRDARHQAYAAKQNLPRLQQSMGMLFTSRTGQNELKKLTEFLPGNLAGGLRGQAQIVLAAYRAGICVSANLGMGGFDTHGNNDQQQFARLAEMWEGIDFLVEEAKAAKIWGNIVIMVGSDFGRTPGYNDGDGKDHWSITSQLLMGKGIPGDTVIGKTTERHNPMNIDPNTLQPVDGAAGIRLKPGHVHRALRRLAGIDKNPIVARFPIKEKEELALFG